jgi:hypothetical protein
MCSFSERTRSLARVPAYNQTVCLLVILLGSCLPAFAQIGGGPRYHLSLERAHLGAGLGYLRRWFSGDLACG